VYFHLSCENISLLTWLYIKKLLPGEVSTKHTVIKHVFMKNDDAVVEKYRAAQEIFDLTLPDHLVAAQNILWSLPWGWLLFFGSLL
jgi:hypothetical protein